MKQVEQNIIQNLVGNFLGEKFTNTQLLDLYLEQTFLFHEELCSKIIEYINYFNSLIEKTCPNETCRILKASHSKFPSLIVLKKSDKLIISNNGKFVFVRTVKVDIDAEHIFQSYFFSQKQNSMGVSEWKSSIDGQLVNPELVASHYIMPFLISGCRNHFQVLQFESSCVSS